jgi:fatty-acyl-CoA synthase
MSAGDRVAFGEYVRSRSQALLRAAQAMTGNRADAEDLLQATLVKAYQSWDRIDDPAALDTYVRRVMVNTHISGWRKRRVDEYPTDELPDSPSGEDATRDSDLHDVVQRAIDRLPRQMRAAVMLRFYDDMTEPEVAAALGVSVGTVKSTVARAVAKLRKDAELGADSLPSPRDVSLALSRPGGVMRGSYVATSPEKEILAIRGSWPGNSTRRRGPAMDSTMMDYPLTITTVMRYGTTLFSDKEVVTCAGDEPARRRSYAVVGERSARLANALRALGVDGDQRVGTFMWNNAEHLEAYLAIPSMGAVLHTLNLRLSADQIGYIATHAGDYAVIVDASLVPLFASVLPLAPAIKHVIVSGAADDAALGALAGPGREVHVYEELLADASAAFDWPELNERSAAAMCYTSGTTGLPKGVAYSHRSSYLHSIAVCTANALAASERDRIMPVVPQFHANAWGLPYASMMSGADLVMPDRFMTPAAVAKLIETEKVTVAAGVPTIWQGMLAHLRTAGGDVSSLRTLVCGGSALPEAVMRAYADEFGITMTHAWGMTELSPIGSVAHEPVGVTGEAVWPYRASQGRLVCGVEGRLTGDDGQVLPSDGKAVGELECRGPWVTAAYYQDSAPEKFHDGWLRTGDVGTLDAEGFIRLTDRAKDVIKSGGEWISSMELENLIMAHPAVAEAAVIGVPDEKWGERPLAAVVLRPDAGPVTPGDLRAYLGERVPRWQLPERWAFIAEVPKTSVGKFQKTTLRDQYAAGTLDVTTLGPTPH